jgi:predicted nucleic acid-binding protein
LLLLDTKILVDLLRREQKTVTWLKGTTAKLSVSVISLMELSAGVRNRREEADLVRLEALVRTLVVDRDIAKRAGVFIRLYSASHAIDDADALIGATAEHHGLELVTLNVKHFPMFPRLKPPY